MNVQENLSVNVLSIFEDTNQSRVQVKVFNKERELSKFFYVPALGQKAVDDAISLGVESFIAFQESLRTPTRPVTHDTTPILCNGTAPTLYMQEDGTTSEVPGDIPPPIPAEAKVKEESKKKRTKAAPKTAPKTDDEWEEVSSPYTAQKSEGLKEVVEEVVAEVVEKVAEVETTPHIKYDKGITEHRSTLATYLTQNHPTWKTVLSKDQIGKLSTDLTGKPFMDVKGNILESFKAEVALAF